MLQTVCPQNLGLVVIQVVTFLGWLSDPLRGYVTSNEGIKMVTLNHLDDTPFFSVKIR